MNKVFRQHLDNDGSIHFFDEEDNEIFPAYYPVHIWRWRAMTVWIIIFSVVVFWALAETRHLSHENNARISDVQQSRILSCRQTYESIRQVFAPFTPTKPTPQQEKNLKLFNQLIVSKKQQCVQQVLNPQGQAPTTETGR